MTYVQVDFYGYTALHAACEAGHADLIVPLLGQQSFDADAYDNGNDANANDNDEDRSWSGHQPSHL